MIGIDTLKDAVMHRLIDKKMRYDAMGWDCDALYPQNELQWVLDKITELQQAHDAQDGLEEQ